MTGKVLSKLKYMLGGERLGTNFFQFLFVHTSFLVFTGLPGIFINTFLMGQTDDINVVLLYNALCFYGTALGMFLSAECLHRFNAGIVSLIGIVGFNVFYMELLLLGNQAAKYYVLLGITNGLAGAFYWMSYSHLLTEYTNLRNRDSGVAILSIFASVVNLIVPLISGSLISLAGRQAGYPSIFIIAFVIAVFTAIGSIRLPKPTYEPTQAKFKQTFHHIKSNRCLSIGLFAEFFRGIRDGVFSFVLFILLYRIVKSEALIGFNTFLSSGLGIISLMLMSRFITPDNRIKYMKISVIALLLFNIGTVFCINPAMLILFTVVNAFFSSFIVNSSFNVFFDILQVLPGTLEKRPELFAIKETCLATGRAIGILFFIFINTITHDNTMWQEIALGILTLTQMGTVLLCRKTSSMVDKIREQEETPT